MFLYQIKMLVGFQFQHDLIKVTIISNTFTTEFSHLTFYWENVLKYRFV